MSHLDELAKLGALLRDGVVTQEEFEKEKARILAVPSDTPAPAPNDTPASAAATASIVEPESRVDDWKATVGGLRWVRLGLRLWMLAFLMALVGFLAADSSVVRFLPGGALGTGLVLVTIGQIMAARLPVEGPAQGIAFGVAVSAGLAVLQLGLFAMVADGASFLTYACGLCLVVVVLLPLFLWFVSKAVGNRAFRQGAAICVGVGLVSAVAVGLLLQNGAAYDALTEQGAQRARDDLLESALTLMVVGGLSLLAGVNWTARLCGQLEQGLRERTVSDGTREAASAPVD